MIKSRLMQTMFALATVLASVVGAQAGAVFQGVGVGEVDGKEVSGAVKFEVLGNGSLQITVTNTATRSDYTPAQVLTGVAFNLPGVVFDVSSATAVVPAGSTLYYAGNGGQVSGPVDVSGEWGLATGVTIPNAAAAGDLGPFGFAISAASFDSNLTRFPGPNLGGPPSGSLGGGDFGLINIESVGTTSLGNFGRTVNTIVVTLALAGNSGPINLADLTETLNPTLLYGSSHDGLLFGVEDDPTPDDSTQPEVPLPVGAWLGLAGVGILGVLRRHKTVA